MQIKVEVGATRNICGLPFLEEFKKLKKSKAAFDWQGFCFGFQTRNVANQKEHLIPLLANTHIRQGHKLISVLHVLLHYFRELLPCISSLTRSFFRIQHYIHKM
ncbi:hypothetical protein RND81_10G065700 [Saponaria officinalis]|uniref:Uncharacterized protein n=1 Tax=Saponaria officinalis TaxID=3572 RepID=A0AAW1HYR4_SAPOF